MALSFGAAVAFRAGAVRWLLLLALLVLRVTDPAAARRTPAADLRPLPGDPAARGHRAAGCHRRHRRKEPAGKLGQWPWPRTRVADLITRLTKLGALVIAFDVVFAEPDRLSPQLAADTFRDLDEATRNKLRSLPSNDQVMADAMRQSKVVLGETGLPVARPADRATDGQPRGSRRSAAIRRPSCSASRDCCRTSRSWKTPPPDAACSAFAPSATASSGACRWSCRRRAISCPR